MGADETQIERKQTNTELTLTNFPRKLPAWQRNQKPKL
jgi:hypothetical protein